MTSNFNQPTFKAHSYEVEHKYNRVTIKTDNEKNLGEEPYLVYQTKYREEQEKMQKDGDLYSAKIYTLKPDFKYHILYKDTGKVDLKDGKDYEINPREMQQKVAHDSRIMHKQPLVFSIKEGKTVGKILYNDKGYDVFDDEMPEFSKPTILVTPHFFHSVRNPNIVGIIFTSNDVGAFSHITTRLRLMTDVCGGVFEPETIKKLLSMDGKNVELEIKDDSINFQETNKSGKPMTYPKINVPKLKSCDKVLTSKEYSSDIIGAKAVNLRRLEELKEQGKIDVIIPKSMALPSGYLEPLVDKTGDYEKYHKLFEEYMSNGEMEKLRDVLKENGINTPVIMVRSSFNGEDLPDYSAAGIYKTNCAYPDDKENLFNSIRIVANSKYNNDALYSRKMYNIPEEDIQPGIILQEMIKPDYKFTLYTDDGKGNVKFDLYSDKGWLYEGIINPHTFTYNKKTRELTYNSIQLGCPVGKFNENQEMKSLEPIEGDLSNNEKIMEQIKKVAQNALVVEKEFGAPQDIEGGLKDDDIYFWQTRNIVR